MRCWRRPEPCSGGCAIMLDNGDRLSVWDLIENDHGHAFATRRNVGGRLVAGAGSVLVGAHPPGIHTDDPVTALAPTGVPRSDPSEDGPARVTIFADMNRRAGWPHAHADGVRCRHRRAVQADRVRPIDWATRALQPQDPLAPTAVRIFPDPQYCSAALQPRAFTGIGRG